MRSLAGGRKGSLSGIPVLVTWLPASIAQLVITPVLFHQPRLAVGWGAAVISSPREISSVSNAWQSEDTLAGNLEVPVDPQAGSGVGVTETASPGAAGNGLDPRGRPPAGSAEMALLGPHCEKRCDPRTSLRLPTAAVPSVQTLCPHSP